MSVFTSLLSSMLLQTLSSNGVLHVETLLLLSVSSRWSCAIGFHILALTEQNFNLAHLMLGDFFLVMAYIGKFAEVFDRVRWKHLMLFYAACWTIALKERKRKGEGGKKRRGEKREEVIVKCFTFYVSSYIYTKDQSKNALLKINFEFESCQKSLFSLSFFFLLPLFYTCVCDKMTNRKTNTNLCYFLFPNRTVHILKEFH